MEVNYNWNLLLPFPPPTLVLPTSASGNGSVAFVVIDENDDARGVLQLSSSTYDTEEPSQDFVIVNRGAGTFGTVKIHPKQP